MDENVDVGEDQRFDIRSSRSLERFRSTPGRVPPDAFETGRRKRAWGAACLTARTAFNPSSISDVNVTPFSAACFFALRNRPSERRIVVRICQSISARHIYVTLYLSPLIPILPRIHRRRRDLSLAQNKKGRRNNRLPQLHRNSGEGARATQPDATQQISNKKVGQECPTHMVSAI